MPPRRKKYGAKGSKRAYRGKKRTGRYGSHPRRSRFKGKASQAIIRQPSGLPDRILVKLKYWESLSYDAAAAAGLIVNVYRINSLFDPDFTGTGGQPYLHDQWSTFYQTYRVHACKVTSQASMQSTGGTSTQYACRIGHTYSSASTSFGAAGQELIQEQPYTKSRNLVMGNADTGQAFIKSFMTVQKLEGRTKTNIKGNPNFEAATNANPTNSMYVHVWAYNPNARAMNVQIENKLVFYVEYFDRARPAVS